MKREDLRAIEGLSEAQVDAVMTLAGRDSAAAHSREEALQQQLNAAQQGLAAFGTQKPSDLASALQQVQQLQTQLAEQARPQITASAILPGTLRRMRGRSMRMM